ncbi:uncharacterized protein METZ01_LOCUS267155 [marine metagenome]|uniref:ATPase BadF/BadG/BcrA/BcrD type domain-containing protein n=1 Tax=marine metagenome TaxID=408172 RepID=A0A382JUS4_9ZZZZ
MILIADSGSTKCSWVVCDLEGNLIEKCKTIGFNPFFTNKESIIKHLDSSTLDKYKHDIKEVFFYGAGCSTKEKNKIIAQPLDMFFNNAQIIISHDIEAACYATYNGKPNISCILGTGSNSCFFDGKEIVENAPALGFLIGDEASGNYFGKKILNLYLNKKLPDDLKKKLESEFETNLSIIKNKTYNNNRANAFLAEYFPFVSNNKKHPIIKELIYKTLEKFFNLHIICYKNFDQVEINFVGSVAYYLTDEIHTTSEKYNCRIGKIIQDPIDGLINYHFKNINLSRRNDTFSSN